MVVTASSPSLIVLDRGTEAQRNPWRSARQSAKVERWEDGEPGEERGNPQISQMDTDENADEEGEDASASFFSISESA